MKDLPANPRSSKELREIPEKYHFTRATVQHSFLLYDSFEDADYNDTSGRLIIFLTQENLRLILVSRMWFVDGTFKISLEIFTQVYCNT